MAKKLVLVNPDLEDIESISQYPITVFHGGLPELLRLYSNANWENNCLVFKQSSLLTNEDLKMNDFIYAILTIEQLPLVMSSNFINVCSVELLKPVDVFIKVNERFIKLYNSSDYSNIKDLLDNESGRLNHLFFIPTLQGICLKKKDK